MRSVYECLLYLYPMQHRTEFGREMADVFETRRRDGAERGVIARLSFYAREVAGLICGALQEHARNLTGSRPWPIFVFRRFSMQSNFRFPKSAIVLMTLILGGVVMAIEKARAIEASLPPTGPPIGRIQPVHFQFLPAVVLCILSFYALSALVWAVLFAFRRSGFHRLEMLAPDQK